MTRAVTVALAPALVTLLTACATTQPSTDSGAAAPSRALRIGLVEWRILTGGRAVRAGVDQLRVTNAGSTRHDLHVTGPGLHAHTSLLTPGQVATLTIDARASSTLTLTCDEPGHRLAGMQTTINVTG